MAEQVNLAEQHQWEAGPNEELKIPEAFITRLKYEIVVLGLKKEFTFRCSDYKWCDTGGYEGLLTGGRRFNHVIIDTSKLDPKGEVELKRVTYHPWVELVSVPFMVVPASEDVDTD